MAPGTRRAHRSGFAAEHDDFEGLPVRQWRPEWVKVAPPPPAENTKPNDIWAVELLHGLPKDAHLLPPHTQELLRAARSGRLYKRPSPMEEEEPEADGPPEKLEKKEEEDTSTRGFAVKTWKPISRNVDDVTHLAKRRKGTVTIASKTVVAPPGGDTITRATVRRIDAAGNPYTEEVTITDGQSVDGEIISTRQVAAPDPSLMPAQQAPPPPRRRPPPPKRKPKGPGRGRKKKLPLPASTRPPGEEGAEGAAEAKPEGEGTETPLKQEGDESTLKDTEMADTSTALSDDEEEGEEGEEGEKGDNDKESGTATTDEQAPDQEMTDAPSTTGDVGDKDADQKQPSAEPLSLVPPNLAAAQNASTVEGSPLKNVMVQSPMEPPSISPLAGPRDQPAVGAEKTEETEAAKTETEKTETEKTEAGKTEIEKAVPEKTDTDNAAVEKTDAEKTDVDKPEADKPETEDPEVENPGSQMSDAEKQQEADKPDVVMGEDSADARAAPAESQDKPELQPVPQQEQEQEQEAEKKEPDETGPVPSAPSVGITADTELTQNRMPSPGEEAARALDVDPKTVEPEDAPNSPAKPDTLVPATEPGENASTEAGQAAAEEPSVREGTEAEEGDDILGSLVDDLDRRAEEMGQKPAESAPAAESASVPEAGPDSAPETKAPEEQAETGEPEPAAKEEKPAETTASAETGEGVKEGEKVEETSAEGAAPKEGE